MTQSRIPMVSIGESTIHVSDGNYSSKYPKSHEFVDSGIPFVSANNLRDGRIIKGNLKFISSELHSSLKKGHVCTGDVLLVTRGSLGMTALVTEEFDGANINAQLVLLRADNKTVDARYLFFVANSPDFQSQVQRNASGTAQPQLPITPLKRLTIPLPPFLVQRRIAGILSAYDDLIENSQRRIKILEEMVRSLYREWFVHFRFPGHDNHPRIASPLGEIPKGWEVVSIDDVCERVTDGSHSSPKSVDEGMPMASSKDMHDWGFTMETCRFISYEDFDELVRNDCKPKKNDVLITKDGANYLKHIFVNREERDVVLLSSIAILRPSARVNPHLLAATLSSPEAKGRLKNYVTGAAIPRIVLKDFKRFMFVLPSQQLQVEWAKLAEPLTKLCWGLVDQTQNLRRTRDLLLPRLLSGQIDIKTMDSVA